ncbi:hypothetical protein NNJEOMEG_03806 [Fundidesulfovibrio magnetotacticus]|uniref:Uncharacterized protein n=1 Tax=Fundidesulfovibrio magnetotacticus TaxID=2730080 RepID=A0A6V8LU47_9BACT|nr:hypothetical protein NNJEOMEG_03806 [Fundidesulfovibrio magnetotacticus]
MTPAARVGIGGVNGRLRMASAAMRIPVRPLSALPSLMPPVLIILVGNRIHPDTQQKDSYRRKRCKEPFTPSLHGNLLRYAVSRKPSSGVDTSRHASPQPHHPLAPGSTVQRTPSRPEAHVIDSIQLAIHQIYKMTITTCAHENQVQRTFLRLTMILMNRYNSRTHPFNIYGSFSLACNGLSPRQQNQADGTTRGLQASWGRRDWTGNAQRGEGTLDKETGTARRHRPTRPAGTQAGARPRTSPPGRPSAALVAQRAPTPLRAAPTRNA